MGRPGSWYNGVFDTGKTAGSAASLRLQSRRVQTIIPFVRTRWSTSAVVYCTQQTRANGTEPNRTEREIRHGRQPVPRRSRSVRQPPPRRVQTARFYACDRLPQWSCFVPSRHVRTETKDQQFFFRQKINR